MRREERVSVQGPAKKQQPEGMLHRAGGWTAKTVKRPRQQPAHPQYANYWAPLTRKQHIPPHPAQPQYTNYWAPRTPKRHQQEHRPQQPTERSDPTQHAKGRTGDRPGPRKETTTRGNATQGGGVDSKNSQTPPATTSTSSIRQLLGAADTQTAHPATSSTAPVHQLLGSANAETTPARAPAAAADRTQRPDATCEGKNG